MTINKEPGREFDSGNADEKRRSSLRRLAAGGAVAGFVLPARWTKPVISGVFLPAHAQTTTEEPGDGSGGTTTPAPLVGQYYGHIDQILTDSSVPALKPEQLIAMAEQGPLSWLVADAGATEAASSHLCIDVNGAQVNVKLQILSNYWELNNGSIGGSATTMSTACGNPTEMSVDDADDANATATIKLGKSNPVQVMIPKASCAAMFGCQDE